jgi:hypothetical protein
MILVSIAVLGKNQDLRNLFINRERVGELIQHFTSALS